MKTLSTGNLWKKSTLKALINKSLWSKIGDISIPKDTGKLIGLFSKDVLDDFLKEHSGEYSGLEKSEQKILNKHINTESEKLIKQMIFKY